jgi:hypothetical protein
MVRQVFSRNFTGTAGNLPSITLWKGPGLTISFVEAEEVIRTISLDDPTELAYSLVDCPQGGGQCQPQLLHLRRIQPLNFAGLTRAKDRSTYLHIVTQPAAGVKKKLYTLRVNLGRDSQQPEYHTLQVLADSQPPATVEVGGNRRATLLDLERGFAEARAQGIVRSALAVRVANFLALVRNGEQVMAAAQRSGISMALVNRLGELGLGSASASMRPSAAPLSLSPEPQGTAGSPVAPTSAP